MRIADFGMGKEDSAVPHENASPPMPAVWYQCQRCANCCRWPGFVRLSDGDIAAIARFLNMSEWDFIQRYTRLRPDRRGLALTERESGACVFLEGKDCAIQAVKPEQCKGFPNAWNFPGWRDVCEAIAVALPAGKS
jgi:Fe-S-cluster containining protein